jgi:hypothetical protein
MSRERKGGLTSPLVSSLAIERCRIVCPVEELDLRKHKVVYNSAKPHARRPLLLNEFGI